MDSLDVHCYREEANVLYEYLLELKTDLVEEDQDRPQQDQLDRKRFLEEFPRVKQELEETIAKLHALADKAQGLHRHQRGGQLCRRCVWRPDHPWPGSGTHDSRHQSGTLGHWVRAGSGGCCDQCVH